jgi:hypothetical protein
MSQIDGLTGAGLRTPKAAAIAGVVFSLLTLARRPEPFPAALAQALIDLSHELESMTIASESSDVGAGVQSPGRADGVLARRVVGVVCGVYQA